MQNKHAGVGCQNSLKNLAPLLSIIHWLCNYRPHLKGERGGVIFSVCPQLRERGYPHPADRNVPPSRVRMVAYPIPRSGGTPSQVWKGGTPWIRSQISTGGTQDWMRVPHPIEDWMGMPSPVQDGMGVLPLQDWIGYPPSPQLGDRAA